MSADPTQLSGKACSECAFVTRNLCLGRVLASLPLVIASQIQGVSMQKILALQSVMSQFDPVDDELLWSTCSSSGCNSSSVFVPDDQQQQKC